MTTPARLVAAGIVFAVLMTGCGAGGGSAAPATRTTSKVAVTTPAPATPVVPAGSSLVAASRVRQLAVRAAPGGKRVHVLDDPTAVGGPLALLVLATRPGWVQVSLPMRPNGSTGWVAADDVTLTTTPYRLVVSMAAHRLDVEYRGERIARYPVGVGKDGTPTVTGTYFLTELIRPPDPHGVYGPYAFGLSAFSDSLQTFAGGPGQIGMHGTDEPTLVGTDVSHGCLRVTNQVITTLAGQLPLGTPVEIRA